MTLERRRARSAWSLLAPMLLVLALAAAWPLARTVWFSLTSAQLLTLEGAEFIGLDNYLESEDGRWYGVLADPLWWRAVQNTFVFALVSVALETVLGLVIALVLHASFRGRGLVRAAVLVPWAIPTIVSAKMWSWMLHDQFGVVNRMLLWLGLIDKPLAFAADPDLAMATVILVDVWKATPFVALLILAALQTLPSSCYEAAVLDGIHPVVVFWRVTLPLIWPAVAVAVIFRLLDALRIFDLIYVLTANTRETMTMSVYARQELVDFQEVGYGSAAATVLFFLLALFTALYLTLARVRLAKA